MILKEENRKSNGEISSKKRYQNVAYADHYDGARYQTLWAQLKNKQTHQTLMKALAFIEPGSTIIDLPCGTGRFGSFLSGLGFRWIGSDISAEMMGSLRKRRRETPGSWAMSDPMRRSFLSETRVSIASSPFASCRISRRMSNTML